MAENSPLAPRRKIAYAVVVLVGFFGLLEGILWVAKFPSYHSLIWEGSTLNPAQVEARDFLREHYRQPGRGEPIPGSSAWRYRPFTSKFLTVNGLGFRGSMPPRCRPDEYRVAVFGGSSVYGWLVADDQTLAAYLEDELRQRLGDRPVTVLNLGVEGYRFQQEVELAEMMWPALEADLMLFVHGANDITTVIRHGWVVDEPWGAGSRMPPLVAFADRPGILEPFRSLLKLSRTATIPLLAVLRLQAGSEGTDFAGPLALDLQTEINAMAEGWEKLAVRTQKLAEVSGATVMTVMQPVLSVKRPLSREERTRLLRAEKVDPGIGLLAVAFSKIVEADGTHLIPIIGQAENSSENAQTLFQDWVHLNPEGNRILAKALAERIDGL